MLKSAKLELTDKIKNDAKLYILCKSAIIKEVWRSNPTQLKDNQLNWKHQFYQVMFKSKANTQTKILIEVRDAANKKDAFLAHCEA